MSRHVVALFLLILGFAAQSLAAEPPAFATKPKAGAAGGKTIITFAVKSPCDAAVWIEDAKGKIVRHLAAGMLGDKTPAPFKKGLTQTLEWDGVDDAGKKVSLAGCKVKVGLGLSAKFDKVLGYDPQTVGKVLSTAKDSKGNIYVMTHDDYPSRSTPQVMVFDPAGKYLRTLLPWAANAPYEKVKPYWVDMGAAGRVPKVHHLFHALYPLAPKQRKRTWAEVARISGEGLKLTPGAGRPRAAKGKGLFRPMHIVASRVREEVFVRQWTGAKWTRIDGRTGKGTPLPFKEVGDLAAAPDGSLYGHRGNSELVRFDRDGKQLAVLDAKILGTVRGGNYRGVRGLGVAPNGDIYLLHYKGVQPGSFKGLGEKGGDWSTALLDVYSPDGKKKQAGLLTLSAGVGGVRVDRAGNIYVAEDIMPPDQLVPPEFKAVKGRELNVYRNLYGSILKFGPKGGKVGVYRRGKKVPDEGVKGVNLHWSGTCQVRVTGDLKGFFPGVAPTGAGSGGCTCYVPRFDLDGFDRLFVPDVARFSVKVLDGRGNLLTRIGSYGNADSAGPKSKIPKPEIAFAWPAYVAVTDEALYVSDMLNRRVLRARLIYAASAECAVR